MKTTISDRPKVILHHSKIELQAPVHYDAAEKQDLLYKFYRKELRLKLSKLVHEYASKMGVEIPGIGIRKMKTKWGSCAITRKHIWFNIELAKKPEECIEYIIVHELAHLLERHHNKNFTVLIDRYFPTWQVQKKILNELPLYHG